jgi:hypothetical protein
VTEQATEPDQNPSTISGHVYSRSGALLHGATILCDPIRTVSLADGGYVLDGLLPGTYEVDVALHGYDRERRRVHLGEDEAVVMDFHLSRSRGEGTIGGVVYDVDTGAPPAKNGTVILLLPITNRYSRIDCDGRYSFTTLPPGDYRLATSIPGYEDVVVALTLAAGEMKLHDFLCKERKAVEPAWG